jgi:transposase-like protein
MVRIVIDTKKIKLNIENLFGELLLDIKQFLKIKNKGRYVVIEESKMDGCPRCHSHHIKFIKISPNGICNGQINECKDCGQWFNIVADYDKW